MRHFLITTPANGNPVLHVTVCPTVRKNARRITVPTWIMTPNVMPSDVHSYELCHRCLSNWAEARAEAWLTILKADHNRLVEAQAERERYARRMAAREAFLAQVEPVRAACQAAWGRRVEFGSYNWNGNLALELYREDGHNPGSIYLTAFDGERVLKFEGLNHSTGLINTPRDAYRLANVFSVIEGWVAPEPLSAPAGAPDFYAIR